MNGINFVILLRSNLWLWHMKIWCWPFKMDSISTGFKNYTMLTGLWRTIFFIVLRITLILFKKKNLIKLWESNFLVFWGKTGENISFLKLLWCTYKEWDFFKWPSVQIITSNWNLFNTNVKWFLTLTIRKFCNVSLTINVIDRKPYFIKGKIKSIF